MSYRFLPWVRRGLAAEITELPGAAGSAPARASFPVRLQVTGGQASVDLTLYGPGDVVGLDTRSIVRIEPRRGTADFPSNQFVAIEFDPPDLPWMFTPAKAGADDRLPPWLVLVVVAREEGVSLRVTGDRPLPQLRIEAPATPSDELPDLAESWAWAHTQVVDNGGGGVPARLRSDPDLNVSRIVCPRRLEPDRAYYACLVPAFETGRLAGLGLPVPETPTTAPAWGTGGAAGSTVVLPVYFHWELRTGPAGDFESLARRLRPTPLPDTVGSRAMFIGDADPALPSLPATVEDGGVTMLEGALRAPAGPSPVDHGAPPAPIAGSLKALLDAAAQHFDSGTPDAAELPAENVAPPIYGSWHVRTHTIPDAGQAPRWLRDLNLDPRHRAAGGLGAEVVKSNQERYMDAAWEQVGDVLDANQALNIGRLIDLVATRALERHLAPLSAVDLFSLTAPMHTRTTVLNRLLADVIANSTLPGGVDDPSFRRHVSPQNHFLKRAARLATAATPVDGSVRPNVVQRLADGDLTIDVHAPLDGLTSSTLIDRLPSAGTGAVSGGVIGWQGTTTVAAVREIVGLRDDLQADPPGDVGLRPNLATTGVLLDRHLERLVSVATDGPPLHDRVAEVITNRREHPAAVGFLVSGEATVRTLELDERGTLSARAAGGRPEAVASVGEAAGRLGTDAVRGLMGTLPEGVFDPEGAGPARTDVLVDLDDAGAVAPFEPVRGGPRTITLDPPVTDRSVVTGFVDAYTAYERAARPQVVSLIPEPTPLDLAQVRAHLVEAVNPHRTVVARCATRIRVGTAVLGDLVADERVRHDEDLGPVMVGPVLPEPLYRDLAAHDAGRFLPGAGEIPSNAVTLLQTNPRFVEAFLVGANHEMNRELLWRGFPTDRRGTPLPTFWDRVDGAADIGPIHRFHRNRRLGSNNADDPDGSLVLLVRGDLLRRYPDSVVYAAPARADGKLDDDPEAIALPVFGGKLDPDITFVGFALTAADITPAPGWFFVIQEQPTEPRFGLDEPDGPPGSLSTWSDLDWAHVDVAGGGHLALSALAPAPELRLAGPGSPTARWGAHAASMAAITFQRPFRVAVHAREVLR